MILAILALPFVVSAGLQLATRRVILASLGGVIILPVMVLIAWRCGRLPREQDGRSHSHSP